MCNKKFEPFHLKLMTFFILSVNLRFLNNWNNLNDIDDLNK